MLEDGHQGDVLGLKVLRKTCFYNFSLILFWNSILPAGFLGEDVTIHGQNKQMKCNYLQAVPELNGADDATLKTVLDNVAFIMPGL